MDPQNPFARSTKKPDFACAKILGRGYPIAPKFPYVALLAAPKKTPKAAIITGPIINRIRPIHRTFRHEENVPAAHVRATSRSCDAIASEDRRSTTKASMISRRKRFKHPC